MPRKGDDHGQGLAEQSLNTSIVHPGRSGSDHAAPGKGSDGTRSPTGNDQRKGLERADPDASKTSDRTKP